MNLPRWVVIAAIVCVLVAGFAGAQDAQQPPPSPPSAAPPVQDTPLLSPDQLDNLVAPIALYPDPLVGQILAASTYPLEIVEAQQWLQQNRNLTGQALVDAAKQQNWDPSVQALVVFPNVLNQLNQDIHWTTDLGNAYLAQQADVMNAIQRMRAKAQSNGKLRSTPQETVTTQQQDGQSAIEIQPTNPAEIYVPEYNPAYIWGPPVIGYYPPLFYPAIGIGFTFGPGIYVGAFFGGCCGWGEFGWGWWPGWFGQGILVNNYFLHRYGFAEFHGGAFRGTEAWVHNPVHRMGVPYPNRELMSRYRGAAVARGGAGVERGGAGFARGGAGVERGAAAAPNRGFAESRGAETGGRFGSPSFEQRAPANHSVFGGIQNGGRARIQSDHGFSSMGSRGSGGFRGGGGGFRGGGGTRGGRGR